MAEERIVLTRGEKRVVQAVYDRFRTAGDWPVFSVIDRTFATGRMKLDASRILENLPRNVVRPLGGNTRYNPDIPVKLRVDGVALCDGSEDDIELFLRALRWMALRERRPVEAVNGTTATMVDEQMFRKAMRLAKDRVLAGHRIGALLSLEDWGWNSGGHNPDGRWSFFLTRDVRRFATVRTLDDYRAAHRRWREEAAPVEPPMEPIHATAEDHEPPSRTPYIDATVVARLQQRQAASSWQCDKLLQLVVEINDSHARGNAYSAHMALRALFDHVPPLFGPHTDFAHAINNHSWGLTDKAYMKALIAFKIQGDDALHRQISRKPGVLLTADDLPPRRQVNRLLDECVALL